MTKTCSKFLLVLPFMAALATQASADITVINVDLRNANILSNIANHLNVNVSNVPVTVQAPISVAAVVCNVDVAILSAIKQGPATCSAISSSGALNKIVQRVINLQSQFRSLPRT